MTRVVGSSRMARTKGGSKAGAASLPQTNLTPQDVCEKRAEVIRARIDRYKGQIIHEQGLVCWHYQHKEYEKAYTACADCQKRWPKHWWPTLMLACIELKLGRSKAADKRLAQLTADHDDLPHWYLVGQLYADAGQMDKARQALAALCWLTCLIILLKQTMVRR